MSIKSNAAKLAPKSAVRKGIEKGNYRGDDWKDVSKMISTVAEIDEMKNGPCNIKFNGKVVGWIHSNGESWIDDKAYEEMRKAYKVLRNEQS